MRLLDEGQVILGVYEVDRYLGEGAFAEVYRVEHRYLGRLAMKVFKSPGTTAEEIKDVLSEAVMLGGLDHPNIIRVYDANTTETRRGTCGFFTMQYVAGGSLDQFWKSHGSKFVPVPTSVEIVSQVCRGLGVAHAEDPPLIHRDVKPQNILVGYDAGGLRARVSDFGLAKRANPLTLMASAKGTLAFKAPEAIRDPQRDSCAGDVWAIGTTLYLLLTDRLPYHGTGELERLSGRAFEQPLVMPSRLNIEVDAGLDEIVARSLSPDPRERYPTAAEMLDDLTARADGPARCGTAKQLLSRETEKSAFGTVQPVDESEAHQMVADALEIARQASRLREAADLMEEAFNRWPPLRDVHEHRVRLWRNGVIR